MNEEAFAAIMQEIAALDDQIDAVVATGEAGYVVAFGEIDVFVDLDAQNRKLVVSADLGAPVRAKALRVYEFLLTYAGGWRETGGVSVGLSGPRGSLMLMAHIATERLAARNFIVIVANMARRAVILRGVIAAGAAADAPTPAISAGDVELLIRI